VSPPASTGKLHARRTVLVDRRRIKVKARIHPSRTLSMEGMPRNVYAEIGVDAAEEMLVKAEIVARILNHIESKKLSPLAFSELTEIEVASWDNIASGQFHDVSIELLEKTLAKLT